MHEVHIPAARGIFRGRGEAASELEPEPARGLETEPPADVGRVGEGALARILEAAIEEGVTAERREVEVGAEWLRLDPRRHQQRDASQRREPSQRAHRDLRGRARMFRRSGRRPTVGCVSRARYRPGRVGARRAGPGGGGAQSKDWRPGGTDDARLMLGASFRRGYTLIRVNGITSINPTRSMEGRVASEAMI